MQVHNTLERNKKRTKLQDRVLSRMWVGRSENVKRGKERNITEWKGWFKISSENTFKTKNNL